MQIFLSVVYFFSNKHFIFYITMVTSIIQHGHHINDLLHWIYFFVLDSINYFFIWISSIFIVKILLKKFLIISMSKFIQIIFHQIFYLKTSIFFVHLQDRITIRGSIDIIGIQYNIVLYNTWNQSKIFRIQPNTYTCI